MRKKISNEDIARKAISLCCIGWFTFFIWTSSNKEPVDSSSIENYTLEQVVKDTTVFESDVILYGTQTEPATTEDVKSAIGRITTTEEEFNLMARVVMSEAGKEGSYESKVAIATTIVNRVLSDKFPDTITEVIKQPNQYWYGNNGEPTEDCYLAVMDAIHTQEYPEDMYYLRTGHYHKWAKDYVKIDKFYFSREKN